MLFPAQLLLLIVFCVVASFSAEDIVATGQGYVQGLVYPTHRAFLSIPYAEAPVGKNRWLPPFPKQPWAPNILQVTKWGPGCPQTCHLPPHVCPTNQSEDCLTLDIYTPRVDHLSTLQPVMAFLPGGRFEQGGPSVGLYNGQNFVNYTGVVLVTVGYRLGVLGWLVTPELEGNFGLLDQRLALTWIQQNIKNFGGDPNQVTLFGQSAGASSLVAHLISKQSVGLFHRAIIESNPVTLPMKTLSEGAALGKIFSEDLGCPNADISCLRSKSVDEIIAAQGKSESTVDITKVLLTFLPWTPTIDGNQIQYGTFEAFQKGNYNHMPLLIGTVAEEALSFIYLAFGFEVDTVEYVAGLSAIFLEEAPRVLYWYPPYSGDKRPTLSVLGTDYIFYCSTRKFVSYVTDDPNNQGVYVYLYNHSLSFPGWGPALPFCVGHVCHGSELAILFDTATLNGYNVTAAEVVLSKQMMTYWTNFARSGNPNLPKPVSVVWPAFNPASDEVLEFATPNLSVEAHVRKEYCDFFDEIGYDWGY